MLLDWVSASLAYDRLPVEHWEALRLLGDRIMRYCPRTGAVQWETTAWDSVRSDSHQIAFKVGGDAVFIQGSPARVCGSGDTVFGEGPSRAMDIQECIRIMARHVTSVVGVPLPVSGVLVRQWKVSTVDVTANFLMDDLPAVRVALRYLRDCEGGRYRVSQTAGDTVYWSHTSHLRKGKAYAKGPQVVALMKKRDYTGRVYSTVELAIIDCLLRMELRLASQYWRERAVKSWYDYILDDFVWEWESYFNRMVGDADMATVSDLLDRLLQVAPTEGQAKAAYQCFLTIQDQGWERAKELYSSKGKPNKTWYRHMVHLRNAGLGDVDIAAGRVVEFRRRVLECTLVNSWEDVFNKAA